ncbi:hypothetical protein [Thalassomonas sp. M1454]|uniref:hypothetical protein n=1 Tax=Thalassomonas sp. M1454 TaxID=2594477 RepID=UPI00118007B0|nr:hypothetical protein [Thalassomonas sp. M1454]TRX57958.1 hypothetical protein FNN08_00800 [Thalassomonas sp. M1454]
MKFITVMAFVLLSVGCKATTKTSTAAATTNESVPNKLSWSCKEMFGSSKELVRLDAYPDEYMGKVYFDGEYESAYYRKEGLKRYWHFGEDGKHQIQLKPNGEAYYHDFSDAAEGESVTSELTLECDRN